MGGVVKFDFEWQEAPGVRDEVLAATWARFSLSIEDQYLTEAVDPRSSSRRTGVYGSLFPLTEWILENWWHLLYEPAPISPLPCGRDAPLWLRPWVQRHNLLAAREGGALPDLTIVSDGRDTILRLAADPQPPPARVRFVGQGIFHESRERFETSAAALVEAVLTRLEERLPEAEVVRQALELWAAINSSAHEEPELCRFLALMGIDPYDPDEATDSLLATVDRSLEIVPESLRVDLFEGSDARTLESNLSWVENESQTLRTEPSAADIRSIEPLEASTAHDTGYLTARKVRSELLGVPDDRPLPNLASLFEERLGWIHGGARHSQSPTHLEGMVGLDDATASLVLIAPNGRSATAERFRLARAAYFPVSRNLGQQARLLTGSATHSQRTARAFAAELLAPTNALAQRVSGRLSGQDVEELAEEFEVSPLVIRHQVENHGLGYVGD